MTSASFLQALRQALRYLYVPAQLRKSPLLALFGIEAAAGPAALRPILAGAIDALKPGSDVPARARPWRAYNALLYLYVQQFTQEEVASALAISSRQLRRQEREALQLLAAYLWERYNLKDRAGHPWPRVEDEEPEAAEEPAGRTQELEWLEKSSPTEVADVAEMLDQALKVAAPLAERLGVGIDARVTPGQGRVAAQLGTSQQALLTTLTATIRAVPGGTIDIVAGVQGKMLGLTISPATQCAADDIPMEDMHESLNMARQLLALSRGTLEIVSERAGQPPLIRLALPRAEQVAVLVIDDNADTLQLFQRYLAGSHLTFVGTRDPQQALALAQEIRPRVIVLDVMLPGIDGWQLLAQLLAHPRTRSLPVIVCSILPEEQLALTLGAAGFLRKPFSREAFLAELDRQVALPSPGTG